MRSIEDILKFRGDISPFLVHLTRRTEEMTAAEILRKIIGDKRIAPGAALVSDLRFGGIDIPTSERPRYFGATCFTETPLSEVHCLFDISYRTVNLESYGLVLLKQNLLAQEVSPVFYLNNERADKDALTQVLYQLAHTNPEVAEKLLPLFCVFGQKLRSPAAAAAPIGTVDFRWEREWRQPFYRGGVTFAAEDVFVGLCPHEEIRDFEEAFPDVKFIDPQRPLKWYATELIHARQRLNLSTSVV
jgi:hypothetical protein